MKLSHDKSVISYYWSQNTEYVILTVLVKTSKIDKVKVVFNETFLDVRLKSAQTTSYRLQLGLSSPIVPSHSSYLVLSAKLELKLKKARSLHWETLEGEIKMKDKS